MKNDVGNLMRYSRMTKVIRRQKYYFPLKTSSFSTNQLILRVDQVDKYGTHFDPAVRDQVVARYKALKLPVFWAGVNAELIPTMGKNGQISSVDISYPHDEVKQYLRYGSMYDAGLKQNSQRRHEGTEKNR